MTNPPTKGKKPVYKHTDIAELVRKVERKPVEYPIYEFSGRTFTKTDKPASG
jgi:hypothetical protein